jgi:purine-cytosine permease-like protein
LLPLCEYHTTNPPESSLKIFLYIYTGLLLPSVPLLILGAAIGGAVPNVPSWEAAYRATGVGGVMAEMLLAPTAAGDRSDGGWAGFGKFVLVLLALSVIGNIAVSMYSVALNLQMLVPCFARVHRFVFGGVVVVVMVPMAIRAAEAWEESLSNFLAVIGYWAGCFDAVVIVELVVFRRMEYASFDHTVW